MRRATVVALAFVAALAAPVRAACGATCVQPEAAPEATVVPAAAPSCHETPAEPKPADAPVEHCSHDHSTSVRPAPRAGGDIITLQPVALIAPAATHAIQFAAKASAPALDVSRGSPPLAINPPLRI